MDTVSCVSVSTAIDYSESSLSEARSCLETLCNFMEAAQAYMRGQLLTEPVHEAVLWDRCRPPLKFLSFCHN